MKLWKSLQAGMKSGHGGHKWVIGKWYTVTGDLDMCSVGFHASTRIIDAMQYVPLEVLAEVEVDGEHLCQTNKQCWQKMRVVKAWKWEKKDSVALAIFAAKLTLGNFEKVYPNDKRPRLAIEAAKKVLKSDTKENRDAAADAAWSAWSATKSATKSAAKLAAESAGLAGSAAWSATTSAAKSAGLAAESAARSGDLILQKCENWIHKHIGLD